MRRLHTIFAGLNTDMSPHRVPSGTATAATDVTVENGHLKKRSGFGMYEDDVDGAAKSVLNIFTARFADGSTYIVAKMADKFLYQRKVYPSPAASFTKITDKWSGHSATEMGWFYMEADRLYYFDSVGGTKWHPSAGVWKAGIGQPTTRPGLALAGRGEKDGWYHVVYSYRDERTQDEGVFGPVGWDVSNNSPLEVRIDGPGGSDGGITATLTAIPANYEADQYVVYCTVGNTEWIGKAGGVQCFSHEYYEDVIVATASAGMNKADHVLKTKKKAVNSGGLPPASKWGCYDGVQAVYGGLSALGKLLYSIPGHATMVPALKNYTQGTGTQGDDSTTVDPEPYVGEILAGSDGDYIELACGAGAIVAYTAVGTYLLRPDDSGEMTTVVSDLGRGCAGHGAAVGTPYGVHAIGYRCWTVTTPRGTVDLSKRRFATTLATIPAGYESSTRMGYYSWKDEVWAAYVPTGATVATSILVWDRSGGPINDGRPTGSLVQFNLAGMTAGEGVTSICELRYEGAEPTMLLGTNKGRVLQYPDSVGDTNAAGTRVHYSADWTGYFGQEYLGYQQRLRGIETFAGSNVADNVTVNLRALRTAGETRAAEDVLLAKSNQVQRSFTNFNKIDARLFQVQYTSTSAVESIWDIEDQVILLDRTDKA